MLGKTGSQALRYALWWSFMWHNLKREGKQTKPSNRSGQTSRNLLWKICIRSISMALLVQLQVRKDGAQSTESSAVGYVKNYP
jgi:hypothetical protein